MNNNRRGRWVLAGLIGLFALPPISAWSLYHLAGWRGAGSAARGDLVEPLVRVPDVSLQPLSGRDARASETVFRGRWTLLQEAGRNCDAACHAGLRAGRQVRALLHFDADRVQRVLLVRDNTARRSLGGLQPDVSVYRTEGQNWQKLFPTHVAAGTIQLIDPTGRWIASYPPSVGADALYADITRLLSLSGRP